MTPGEIRRTRTRLVSLGVPPDNISRHIAGLIKAKAMRHPCAEKRQSPPISSVHILPKDDRGEMGRSLSMYWSSPGKETLVKKAASARIKARKNTGPWSDPEHRAKISAAIKAKWSDPEHRAKHKAAMNTPAYRAKQSAAQKAAWARPAYRAKLSAARKVTWSDPAHQAKISKIRKASWSDPAIRAKHHAACNTPETRERFRLKALARWSDPAYRARREAARAGRKADAQK